MADNYLEKKYEEWKNGKPTVRRSTPSLEALIKQAAASGTADSSYIVKQAQLDAIIRTASELGYNSSFATDEDSATVKVFETDKIKLGEIILAIRLKAAELKLMASVQTMDAICSVIKISKAL
ncbi:MAG: hypothetical protein Q4G10_02245 [Bacteroidia bacterium]|nr:hypothetical protein [Bacteroidia bacterium]